MTDERAGLAHARLSISYLSPARHQPMASVDGTVQRRDLQLHGDPPRARSSRLSVSQPQRHGGYRQRLARLGHQDLFWLHGMFALEIWNRRARRLILARNRIGKKPLYYAATADTFLFGSEIKALLTWPGPPRATDLSAIDRYVTWGYMPTLYTAFKGIRKLAAAHYLRRGAYRRLHGVGVRPLLASPPRGGTAR